MAPPPLFGERFFCTNVDTYIVMLEKSLFFFVVVSNWNRWGVPVRGNGSTYCISCRRTEEKCVTCESCFNRRESDGRIDYSKRIVAFSMKTFRYWPS
jgi:hypothetical protein